MANFQEEYNPSVFEINRFVKGGWLWLGVTKIRVFLKRHILTIDFAENEQVDDVLQ